MKLRFRILIVSIVIGIFSYLFYDAYKEVKNQTLKDFNSLEVSITQQASLGIQNFFDYYQTELTGLSRLSFISDLNNQGKDLLKNYYENHVDEIMAISYIDDKGILQYTYPYLPNVIGQDISGQKHIQTVISTHKSTISDVFTAVQGYKAIAFHVPVMKGDIYKGSLALLIPVDRLGKMYIENIKTGKTGFGLLISEEGIVLFSHDSSETGKLIKDLYSQSSSLINLLEKTASENEGYSICGINNFSKQKTKTANALAAFYKVPLGNTYWTILTLTPEKEVFETMIYFRNRLIFIFILIIFCFLVYFYLSLKASNVLKEEKKRKAVESILIESEKRFRTMFELSPAGIILIDEKGTIIEVNSAFCKTLGYSRKELLSNNVRLFSIPDNENEIEDNIAKILSGKTLRHEVINVKKDGSKCEIELYETMITLPYGNPGILSVSNDISDKKRSQEKMRTLSLALESISECVSITDYSNKIIFVNNSFCRTYGYSSDELIGNDISMVRSNINNNEPVYNIIQDTMNGGWNGELINLKKDGTEFPIELSTSPIVDENGKTIALIGIASDISERKKVQQELIYAKEKAEESDKLKSAFLTNMSHELRTPLNAIIGFSGLMTANSTDKEIVENLKIISNSGQHLLGLVEEILDISMIETGHIKIVKEKIELHSLLNQVKNIIQGERLKENKTEIDLILNLDKSSDEFSIVTDPGKLKQVFINLLKNALKFTEKGFIEFGYDRIYEDHKKLLKFYVKDTGIGIEDKYHDVIFNIFRQIDDSHTRKYSGTGIGLSIAKRIVEILGGKIWLESEPGKGSVFYFTLYELSNQVEMDIKKPDTGTPDLLKLKGKSILVAEDEFASFELLRIYLNKLNIRVLRAKNGEEAVIMCEKDPNIDLILMDIKMPLLNGLQAARIIKEKYPELPIVTQTAYATLSEKLEAEKLGCNGYLTKPIDFNKLNYFLTRLL
jgi:PAS domain S-box-containing protein